jgi:hypothetical protein
MVRQAGIASGDYKIDPGCQGNIMRFKLIPLIAMVAAGHAAHAANNAAPGTPASVPFDVRVVSSAPDQVSGGDARLHVVVPQTVPLQQVEVWVNGKSQRDRFAPMPGTRTLTGVIDGLVLGENSVQVNANGKGKGRPDAVQLKLTNHPIIGPIFSGPHQYPFVCNTVSQGLGQPIADDAATGTKVFDASGAVAGLSRNCSVETRVDYRYLRSNGTWGPLSPGDPIPGDAAATTSTGAPGPVVVRWERGTINRFIYSIAVPIPWDDDPSDLDRTRWNGGVVYRFDGGVAIGHTQGSVSGSAMLYTPALERGYAILHSSGTRTSTHYNLQVGGETALMVKERFIELYDLPRYTVGIGGSGGAIQQYVYAQNHPGLIDAGIPQVSYPDMVTQAVHVGDCELMEHFMDVLDGTNPKWATWTNRTILEGMAASNTFPNPFRGGLPGNTECINGWRGLSPLALNPNFGQAPNQANFVPLSAIAATEWSHFGDIVNIVGRAADGYARNYWDNVGVQYGLRSVAGGQITPLEFLKLNGVVGGWKNEPDMVQEGFPFLPGAPPSTFDPWSRRNQVFSLDPFNSPAPRNVGDIEAMRAVYRSGLVFMGDIDIPILDVRPYLETVLDMHNSHQSFASRKRMLNADGDASNQSIWFINGPGNVDITPYALDVMDQWMSNIAAHPKAGVAANKPAEAVDRCFETDGTPIAAGDDVWAGILDGAAPGACTQRFQLYSTTRRVAGGPFEQSLFKCQLMSVETAIARGLYGVWTPSAAETAILQNIFPQGVCDYSKPDVGLPPEW